MRGLEREGLGWRVESVFICVGPLVGRGRSRINSRRVRRGYNRTPGLLQGEAGLKQIQEEKGYDRTSGSQ